MKNSELFNGPLGEDHRAFTDDDLKRFKVIASAVTPPTVQYWIPCDELLALIGRLEASESCFNDPECECTTVEMGCWHQTSYAKWRAAAGKS